MNRKLETLWVRYTHPENGWPSVPPLGVIGDREKCDKYLQLGKPYRVVRLYDRLGCRVDVQLEGIGKECLFNSVMFDFENYKRETIPSSVAFNAPQYEDYWFRDII